VARVEGNASDASANAGGLAQPSRRSARRVAGFALVMRLLSFALLAFAAFDWPAPWLDRAGTAALGFAFLALAVSPGGFLRSRPARMTFPPKTAQLADEPDDLLADVLDRIEPFVSSERA